MLSTIAGYQLISSDMARSLERTAKTPNVALDSDYYRENIGKITSVDEFLDDYRLYSYAMKAFGLGDMAYAKAFMRKVLNEGVADGASFANKLTDKRYREFATVFDFDRLGALATQTNMAQNGTVDKYVRQKLEEDAGQDNEGIRLALYFERKAASIGSVYQILGDPALLKVAQTTFNLSPQTGSADIDRQAEMYLEKLDIADLQDPIKLKAFIQRFTAMWEMQNPTSSASIPSILLGQTTEMGMSADTLMSLQNLKFGKI